MRNKNFLLGIFSVVSFVLISTFVTTSTFAQCPPDVSGTWILRSINDGGDVCCNDVPDPDEPDDSVISIVVTQLGDEISAAWEDIQGDGPTVLTGIVNGNSVYFKIETTYPGGSCVWTTQCVGIVKGRKANRIKGYFTGAETCGTCRWLGKFRVKIVK